VDAASQKWTRHSQPDHLHVRENKQTTKLGPLLAPHNLRTLSSNNHNSNINKSQQKPLK